MSGSNSDIYFVSSYLTMLFLILMIAHLSCFIGCIISESRTPVVDFRTNRVIRRSVSIVLFILSLTFYGIAASNTNETTVTVLFVFSLIFNLAGSIQLFIRPNKENRAYQEFLQKKEKVAEVVIQKNPEQGETYIKINNNQNYVDKNDLPMTTGQWMCTIILLMIPLVNIICAICWFFGAGNKSRRTYVRAYVFLMLIILGIALLIGGIVLAILYAAVL